MMGTCPQRKLASAQGWSVTKKNGAVDRQNTNKSNSNRSLDKRRRTCCAIWCARWDQTHSVDAIMIFTIGVVIEVVAEVNAASGTSYLSFNPETKVVHFTWGSLPRNTWSSMANIWLSII